MYEYHSLKFDMIYNMWKIYIYIYIYIYITYIHSSLIAAWMIVLIQDMT